LSPLEEGVTEVEKPYKTPQKTHQLKFKTTATTIEVERG